MPETAGGRQRNESCSYGVLLLWVCLTWLDCGITVLLVRWGLCSPYLLHPGSTMHHPKVCSTTSVVWPEDNYSMCKNYLFLLVLPNWKTCMEPKSSPGMPEQGSGTLRGVHVHQEGSDCWESLTVLSWNGPTRVIQSSSVEWLPPYGKEQCLPHSPPNYVDKEV